MTSLVTVKSCLVATPPGKGLWPFLPARKRSVTYPGSIGRIWRTSQMTEECSSSRRPGKEAEQRSPPIYERRTVPQQSDLVMATRRRFHQTENGYFRF